MPNLGQNQLFLPHDLEIWQMTLKNNRAPLLCYLKIFASFDSHRWIQTWVSVRKSSIWTKIGDVLSCVILKFDGWPRKTIEKFFCTTASFVHHFLAICGFKLELQSRNAQIGAKFVLTCVTLTFCMAITFANGNNSWKFHDDMMTGTLWAVRDCLICPYARISECLVSYLCLDYECQVGHSDSIPVKCELNISCSLLSIHTNSQVGTSKSIWTTRQQGKSEGFDSCDRPSNLTQIGLKLSIFQPVRPWKLTDDLQKQQGTSSMLLQALCIIS